MSQPRARPVLIAISTTRRFSTGSTPGWPVQTAQVFEFGGEPNEVEQPQKILLAVRSWA